MAILKKIRSGVDKVRKKYIPTFGEQFDKAKKEGKKTFTSTRDDKKKGKLEYSTETKAEKKAAQKKMSNRERARVGDKSKQLSEKGAAFKLAKKSGKDTFTHKGKKYTTLLKGEKKKKPLITGKGFNKKINISKPELSGKTSKKIKKVVRGDDYRDVSARKGGLIRGIPKLATKGY
jgi:hypothetical protein|tara:strand:- start:6416 stop:6943 length:528 start_codon:yes stop_codon:yes gene_type:complete